MSDPRPAVLSVRDLAVAKLTDVWLHPKQGTDAALAFAFGHVILREFHLDRATPYFVDYCRRYTDMPMLVKLVRQGDHLVPDRFLRASDFVDKLSEANNPEWKTLLIDETSGRIVAPKDLPERTARLLAALARHDIAPERPAAEGLPLRRLEERHDVRELARRQRVVAVGERRGHPQDYRPGRNRRTPSSPTVEVTSPSRSSRRSTLSVPESEACSG